jgi:NAD(P)-dependent dehydrogenase (short-subunit alcohol dehydrogenase family)
MTCVALVSGAGRGIGRGIALELAESGADVAIAYNQDEAAAQAVADEVRRFRSRAAILQADLADPACAEQVVAAAVDALGRIDILVTSQGVLISAPFLETTPEQYETHLAVNTRGSFFLIQAAAKQMIAEGHGGRIIVITSEASDKPVPGLAAYCVSKAAQKMVMKMTAVELAPHGIRVNAVAPGTVETDMNRAMLADDKMRRVLLADVLLSGPGMPEDIAAAVSYLSSERSRYVTGSTIAVNGGSVIS